MAARIAPQIHWPAHGVLARFPQARTMNNQYIFCKPLLRWPILPCRAGADPSGGADDNQPDIDELARLLSQQAAKLRASLDEGDLWKPDTSKQQTGGKTPIIGPFGIQDPEFEAKVLAEIGDGGFESLEFEMVQRLGRISVVQESGSGDVASFEPRAAVIAYAARYHSRLPYSRPLPTLLKEYLPLAKAVACNELLLFKHLCGIPDDKYRAAEEKPSTEPPVVPLLGYFTSAPSEEGSLYTDDDSLDSLWLVYKWEGLKPLSLYNESGPPTPMPGFFKSREVVEAEAWAARCTMLKAIATGILEAVDFCHSADVVHGSLGSGSVLLSTCNDQEARGLITKLDNFGFGKWYSHSSQGPGALAAAASASSYGPLTDGDSLEAGKRHDLQAVALALAEAFASGLAPAPSDAISTPLDRVSLQRLLFDVFHEDIQLFRDYCIQDPQRYSRLVDFLDANGNAGWDFFSQLLRGKSSTLQLQQHRFLRS